MHPLSERDRAKKDYGKVEIKTKKLYRYFSGSCPEKYLYSKLSAPGINVVSKAGNGVYENRKGGTSFVRNAEYQQKL